MSTINEGVSIEPLQIKSERIPFILKQLGNEMLPEQFLREFTQNSIEAIQAAGGEGHIYWQNDPNFENAHGAPKLSIVDNGVGMSSEELMEYMDNLWESSKNQSLDGNFGIGARLASLESNPLGVVVQSWKHGKGNQITLITTTTTGPDKKITYGVRRMPSDNGEVSVEELDDAYRPTDQNGNTLIGDHGTKVTLLGTYDEANTMAPPNNVRHGQYWIIGNLNRRYRKFPNTISVFAPRLNNDYVSTHQQQLVGQETYLEDNAIDSGVLRMSTAKVHWWIMDELSEKNNSRTDNLYAAWERRGHIAVLYQNELYDSTTGPTRMARMTAFGIHSKRTRVVLYVEPLTDYKGITVASNLERTLVTIDGKPLPWEDYGAEFYRNMPTALKQFVEQDLDQEELEDLQEMRDKQDEHFRSLAIDFPKYVESKHGTEDTEFDQTEEVLVFERFGDGEHGPVNDPNANGAQPTNKRVTRTQKPSPNATKAVKVDRWERPKVFWVNSEDGSRDEGFMEDRMGSYSKKNNVLYLNADFRGLQSLVSRVTKFKAVGNDPLANHIITKVTRQVAEKVVVSHIFTGYALKGGKHWTDADINVIYSEESITASIMSDTLVYTELKTVVGRELAAHPQQIVNDVEDFYAENQSA